MPPLGSSKYIDLLNDEALEEFGKKYIDLTDPQKTLIRGRIGGRVYYKKVDPSETAAGKTEKNIKDFIKKFKKENKRRPMIAEISEGTGSHHSQITKYATVGKTSKKNKKLRGYFTKRTC